MFFQALMLAGGIGALYAGAYWLVRGAGGLGKALGAPPIVVGLTVVSLGTSAPELVVCVLAAAGGNSDLAIGNALGSNLANIGLILAVTGIVHPLKVNRRVVFREVPAMLAVTLLLYPLAADGSLSQLNGVVLLGVLALYLGSLFRSARGGALDLAGEFEAFSSGEGQAKLPALGKNLLLVVAGSGVLVIGGRAIVASAVHIATAMGVSELLIGGTVVAVGTSLPELATSVVAATRNEADLAVGNVIGSNIFNLTAVLGAAAVIEPLSIAPGVFQREYLAMVVLSVLVFPMAWSAFRVGRGEGALLLAFYGGFWVWLAQA